VGVDPLSGSVFLMRSIDARMVAIPEQCELAWCCLNGVMSEEEWSLEAWKILSCVGKRHVQDIILRSTAREAPVKPLGRASAAVSPRRRPVMLPGSIRRLVPRLSYRSCKQVAPETSQVILRDNAVSHRPRACWFLG